MEKSNNIIKILGGVIVLFLGFYIMYLGSETGSKLIILGGVLIAVLGSIIIFTYRYRENLKVTYMYKKTIEELKKDPDNEELIENAYKWGKEFYRLRRGDGMLTKKEKKIIEMDIAYIRGKLEE